MSRAASALRQLQRRAAARRPPRPVLFVTYGLDDDDLYHGAERTYTRAELGNAEKKYQVIVFHYGDWLPDDGQGVTQ
jgi:hypothetical protein